MERALIEEYRMTIEGLLGSLSAAGYDRAVEIAELPDMIRGYEDIKEANVELYRAKLAELLG
jgi:indolepyruvate ferredoxin oxidoreductase